MTEYRMSNLNFSSRFYLSLKQCCFLHTYILQICNDAMNAHKIRDSISGL